MLSGLRARAKRDMSEWTASMAGRDFFERIKSLAARQNEFGVDPFGFSLDFSIAAIAPLVWMYKHYFRVETNGASRVPAGRVLLVSNHGGQLPFDGAMIGVALLLECQPPRAVRSMVERWVPTLPFVSTAFARAGQVVGTPENCKRLLESGEAILVFPEGLRGISKTWWERYQLQEFGLGFMRLALETQTPIVPVGVAGAEEQAPSLLNLKRLGKMVGLPALPVTPLGLPLPLPSKYVISFGDPIWPTGNADDDDAELRKQVDEVKRAISGLVALGREQRNRRYR